MVVDLNANSYTNTTGSNQTITPVDFTFAVGTGPALNGNEVQPFIVEGGPTGPVLAIGTTNTGPFTSGTTVTNAFGGSGFILGPGQTMRLGARTIGTSGGCPVAFAAGGSATLTGGPATTDAGSLPGVGSAPAPGTTGFTGYPRTYQISATYTVA